VSRGADVLDWVIDPFARDFGVGKLSAVVVGEPEFDWGPDEETWRTPLAEDLVYYEIDLAEYGRDLAAVADRLPYLADLGVNCVQLMPVNNVTAEIDWGYLPAAQLGVDDRLGDRPGLRRLVAESHRLGMAVVFDVVYGHTGAEFAYVDVYRHFAIPNNPVMGDFGQNMFGESTGWDLSLTQDYFFTASHLWLDLFHVDGFRYDCVPNFWRTPFDGYGELCYRTYRHVAEQIPDGGHWRRFAADDRINLVQCAEQLEAPRDVMARTYSTSTWQNETLDAARATVRGEPGALARLGQAFALLGYPESTTFGTDVVHQAPLQYLENHDHPRFLCEFGTLQPDERDNELFRRGNRDSWFRLQPYLIGLLTAKGAPLLFQGEELCEDDFLPDQGLGRVAMLRPVQWEYFYTVPGRGILRLVRTLLRLRRAHPELRRGAHFFHNDDRILDEGVLLQSRAADNATTLVAINVTGADRQVPFTFARAGDYDELLHGQDNLLGVAAGETRVLTVPSNYGRLWRVI
jgi:maltooligosyltrehalose trehalohydrolase